MMGDITATAGIICTPGDLADPGCRGFTLSTPDGLVDAFLVYRCKRVYGYLNRCPHTGGPLDWMPDQFLDAEQKRIQCATHGALFRIEDGLCIAGPCAGECLTALPLIITREGVAVDRGAAAG